MSWKVIEKAVCEHCHYQWVAVCPVEVTELECPECRRYTSIREKPEADNEFVQLVDLHRIQIPTLMQACSAPIKVLLDWFDNGAPDWAIAKLKDFLGEADGRN